MKTTALSRLLEGVRRPAHDYRASIQAFPDLDVNRVASEMSLEDAGRERGERDEPATGSVAMDDVEARIIERIESERKAAHAAAEDELRTYAERLSALDFEGRFAGIRQAAPACIGEFKAEVAKGLNSLHGRRRDLGEAERAHGKFRERNRLERDAKVPSPQWHFMKLALIGFLFVVEAALNGSFLAKGNEQGLLGGFTEAFGFAFVNIGFAVLLAKGVAQIAHRSVFRKFVGLVALAVYGCVATGLNLSLAHYREVTASMAEGGGRLVMQRLQTTPFALDDFNSWIFFAIGLLFSIIAFFDSLSMSDAYPGFTAMQKDLIKKRAEYEDESSHLIDTLSEIKDQYREDMDELNRDLSVRRGEHDVILTGRARLVQLFEQHQGQLERAANALLTVYRESNARARKTKPPKRFNTAYKMDRASVFANSSADWEPRELRKHIADTQELLNAEVSRIHTEFDHAISRYHRLDDLFDDGVTDKEDADVSRAA